MNEPSKRPPTDPKEQAASSAYSGEIESVTRWVTPTAESEPRLMIRQADVRRWEKAAERLKKPKRNPVAWATAFFGAGIGLVGSALSSLAAPEKPNWEFVRFLLVTGGLSFALCIFMYYWNKRDVEERKDDATLLCDDIHGIAADPSSKVDS